MKNRTARKQHPCDRQSYYDRLSPAARDWYNASPCPLGGVIAVGTAYVESEGDDQFHPSRHHTECFGAYGWQTDPNEGIAEAHNEELIASEDRRRFIVESERHW